MSSSDLIPLQIAGYKVLPLSFPPLPSFPTEVTHYLYLAPHQPKIPTPSASRSLFLVNLPIDSTEAHIKHLLSAQLGLPAGRIEDVEFDGQRKKRVGSDVEHSTTSKLAKTSKKRKRDNSGGITIDEMEGTALPSVWDRELQTGGRTAVVLFVDKASVDAVLTAIKHIRQEQRQPVWGEGIAGKIPPLGSARYINHEKLKYPDKAQLLESVNTFMAAYAEKEASEARLRAKQRQEVDADGFVTVTRGGRTNPARQEAAQEHADKQKKKQKGLDDFYRFQSREKKKEKAFELVRKFEEDKEKVRKMREQRGRFKPE